MVPQWQILEQDQEKKNAVGPKRGTAVATHQLKPAEVLLKLLDRLNKEAAILNSSSPRFYMDCLCLTRDIDEVLKPHIDIDKFYGVLGSLGKKVTRHGKQLTGMRLVPLFLVYTKHLPIARRVLIRWLESNGGNGAVSFPKPPSRKES